MEKIVLDFETYGIEDRPNYPPRPVGLAVRRKGRSQYMAFGHPEENNCEESKVADFLKSVWGKHCLVFHNGAFDMEVAAARYSLPILRDPKLWDDTLILAYLHDPRDPSLSLKPLADKYLDMPPEEQDRLKDWILANVPEAKKKPSTWGAYIALAPGKLVGDYAIGDVERTWRLYNYFMADLKGEDRMKDWYAKEKRLIPIKIGMESGGIRAASNRLKKDIPKFKSVLTDVESGIRRRLKISKKWERENCKDGVFNPNSTDQLASALDHSGKVSEWIMTPAGNRSTSRANLEQVCTDKKLIEMLALQGVLTTYLGTFLEPWLRISDANGGYIHPSFNTVRSTDEYGGKRGVGTRTGRLSSSNPNFQNIPADVSGSKHAPILTILAALLKKEGVNFIGLRDYLVPDDGCVFIGRDYSQQELRILAHYEDGVLLQMYRQDPNMDIHTVVQKLVHEIIGILFPRKAVKETNFGIIYGMGAEKIGWKADVDEDTARKLKSAVLRAVPGIKDVSSELTRLARQGMPIYTWGGRRYYVEEPKKIKGQLREFYYKLLNLLIQGSAADCTKEAMLACDESFNDARLVLQVHDELLGCAPKSSAKREMKIMKDCMESVKFDVPMLTEGKMGAVSWARMRDVA